MKMVVLVENSSRCRLCAEHGLSVYIEYEGKTYLLDTGATALFAENAKELKQNRQSALRVAHTKKGCII